jgi:hypothetical protein
LTILQPGPDATGDPRWGDVAALKADMAKLGPSVLTRLSNRNLAWICAPDSADQAFGEDNIADLPVQGWPAGSTWGDVGGGYFWGRN